jgi:CPA1 family monovalent cation:H+ antiporter
MDNLVEIETLVLELLLIVSVVAVAVRRFRIPYTVALVLVGAALSLQSPPDVRLTSELILSLFLPPLVFEAAFHLRVEAVLRNLPTLVLFAIVGVVLTMLVAGGVVAWGTGLPLSVALVFGSLIAATDPVAVVAMFRRLGVPKRLEVLLEGESLLNDGTAIVLFGLALASRSLGQFDLVQNLVDFVRIAAGGLAVGLLLGWVISRFISSIDDYLVEITLTTVLAYGSYLIAEQLHVSGVLAVVAAGLVNGNIGPRGMSPTTRIVVLNFWEYIAFLANSAVFLLIGREINLPGLIAMWREIAWGIAAVLVARAVVVYSLTWFGDRMPWRWRHALFWGGLRGAIALALALSLPADFGPQRNMLVTMTFGVVLFTLVGQGVSMPTLVRRLGLIERTEAQDEYERRHARAVSAQASHQHLARQFREGTISGHTWERLGPVFEQRAAALSEAAKETVRTSPEIESKEMDTARREALRAGRASLPDLRRDGIIGEETYAELVAEIDMTMATDMEAWAGSAGFTSAEPVVQMLVAVVQRRDQETASNALAARSLGCTVLQSHGGFLGLGNSTLLIGIPEGKTEQAVVTLEQVCRSRVEYLTTPMAEAPHLGIGEPIPVTIRGATVFVFDVERYEEY